MDARKKIKLFLLSGILVALLGISALVSFRNMKENPEKPLQLVPPQSDSRMEDIHYTQTNDEGIKEWEFEAKSVNYFEDTKITLFQNIRASFFTQEGKTFTLKGDKGKWHMDSNDMEITDNVLGTSSDGYEFRTNSLTYVAQNRKISSPDKVRLTYQNFELEGRGMVVEINKGNIFLLNNVKAMAKQ